LKHWKKPLRRRLLGDLSQLRKTRLSALQVERYSQDRYLTGFLQQKESHFKYKDIGLMLGEMISRKLGLGDDEDARWRPVRPLGHGAFGAAGLFNVQTSG
jgi:hypothetical protein